MSIRIFQTLIAILIISFPSCDRAKQVVTPDTLSTDTITSIKIGVIQPSGYYTGFAQGAELAQTQINESGGLLGKRIEFIVMDNQGDRPVPDATESVRIAKMLIEQEGVAAILGPIFSNNSMQVGPVVQELGLPIISGSAGEFVTAAGDFVFLIVPPTSVQAAVMAQFAVNPSELDATTAATIRQADSAYTEGLTRSFEKSFQELGGKIVASELYEVGDKTFDTQLARIKAASSDVLYIAGVIPEIHFVMAQAREFGILTTFLGMGSWDEPEKLFSTLADNVPLENSYFTTNFSPELPNAAQFIQAYTELFMIPPDGMAAAGYDAMSLLTVAIESAQTLNPVAIRDALSNITNHQGATLISHYDANRHPVKSVVINTIRNGQVELYKIVEP